MVKKSVCLLVVLCVVLTLGVPTAAAAMFERPAQSAYWHELPDADAGTLVNAAARKTWGHDLILVFYSTNCFYCSQMIPQFVQYADAAGVTVYGVSGSGTDGTHGDLSVLYQNHLVSGTLGWPVVMVYDAQSACYTVQDCVRDMDAFESLARCTRSSRPSGQLTRERLSPAQLSQLLAQHPNTMPEGEVFDQAPSCSAPYAAGKVNQRFLQAAADRLNVLRIIAGLPEVALDPTLCETAQHGAVILGQLGGLSHTPAQPADMDDEFYARAYDATSSSNLYAGLELTLTPDGFMNDSDVSNISRLGHRRWQLFPKLGKVGFGYVETNTGYYRYTDELVFDWSGDADYDYIAWPSSGHFPLSAPRFINGQYFVTEPYFDSFSAWSVTLNPNLYAAPVQSQVTVTLTRAADGQEWVFSGNYQPSISDDYFIVDHGGYGVDNCIIFRPGGIDRYEGLYTVTIDGLKTRSGAAVDDFQYTVEFFDPAAPTQHAFDAGLLTQAPTKTSPGVRTHTCWICGATEEESLPRLGTLGVKDWAGSTVTLYDPSDLLSQEGLLIFAASYASNGKMTRVRQCQAHRQLSMGQYSLTFQAPLDPDSVLFFLRADAGPVCPALPLPDPAS